jgi:hypothetical protein
VVSLSIAPRERVPANQLRRGVLNSPVESTELESAKSARWVSPERDRKIENRKMEGSAIFLFSIFLPL